MKLPTLQELVVMGLMAAAALGVIVFVCSMIAPERTARALGIVKIALVSFMKPFRRGRGRDPNASMPPTSRDDLGIAPRRPAVKAPTISDFALPPEPRERSHRDG